MTTAPDGHEPIENEAVRMVRDTERRQQHAFGNWISETRPRVCYWERCGLMPILADAPEGRNHNRPQYGARCRANQAVRTSVTILGTRPRHPQRAGTRCLTQRYS